MKKILIIILVFILTDCSVNISKVNDNEASEIPEKITYVKDQRTGLCFGIIASRKSFRIRSQGIGIVCVPCEEVDHLLFNGK